MVILISGGSCSGKTTFAGLFKQATVIHMDDFYWGKSHMTTPYNFDEPEAIDIDGMADSVERLSKGLPVSIPKYSMVVSERVGTQTVKPNKNIVVEGIFVFSSPKLRKLADLSIYLEVPADERVRRRIHRDEERGRNMLQTLEHSLVVEKMHEKHVEPMKKYASLICPFGVVVGKKTRHDNYGA